MATAASIPPMLRYHTVPVTAFSQNCSIVWCDQTREAAVIDPGGDLPDLRLTDPEVVEIGRRKDVPIWDRWWYLAALALTLGAEWVLRRRWGYW